MEDITLPSRQTLSIHAREQQLIMVMVLKEYLFITELGTTFIPNATTMNTIINNNLSAGLILIDRIFDRVVTGNITDSLSNDYLNAEVFVSGIDDTGTEVEPYMSGPNFWTL